jgi:hypothetical protein
MTALRSLPDSSSELKELLATHKRLYYVNVYTGQLYRVTNRLYAIDIDRRSNKSYRGQDCINKRTGTVTVDAYGNVDSHFYLETEDYQVLYDKLIRLCTVP